MKIAQFHAKKLYSWSQLAKGNSLDNFRLATKVLNGTG